MTCSAWRCTTSSRCPSSSSGPNCSVVSSRCGPAAAHRRADASRFSYVGRVILAPCVGLVAACALILAVQSRDPLASRTKGRADAPVTVYEMADFQCPACRLFAVTVLPTLEREYVETGKVRWVFIHLPLTSIHPNAMAAAEV